MEQLLQELLDDKIEKKVFAAFPNLKSDLEKNPEAFKAAIKDLRSDEMFQKYEEHISANDLKKMYLESLDKAFAKLRKQTEIVLNKILKIP